MLEWMIPIAVGGLALVTKSPKKSDKAKIETIMKNVGYCIKKTSGYGEAKKVTQLYPEYKNKSKLYDGDKEIGTRYFYDIPLGLQATKLASLEKDDKLFTDGLQKPIEVTYKAVSKQDKRKRLQFSVYDEEIPEFFPYSNLPSKTEEWVVPIGKRYDGLVWHNFDWIPHMNISGTTRFGKTVLEKLIMTYLIENHPDDVEIFIIDLKGGLEFGPYENLKQVEGVAKGPQEAYAMLKYLTNEFPEKDEPFGLLEYEMEYYRQKGYSNILDTDIKKRRFIIIDEGAQLAPGSFMKNEDRQMLLECQSKLSRLAAVSGALGYRMIFATQYPVASTLPREIKQNSDAKISFRLPTGYASGVAIDDTGAEELPSDIKGRALFKTHELREMQVPYISDKEMKERLKQWEVATHDPHHAPKNEESAGGDTFYIR